MLLFFLVLNPFTSGLLVGIHKVTPDEKEKARTIFKLRKAGEATEMRYYLELFPYNVVFMIWGAYYLKIMRETALFF